MRSIRCGKGLGDSVYLQSVVRHIIKRDRQPLKVASDWPDVFLPLQGSVKVIPFTRNKIDITAHYITRKGFAETTVFRDCCINAGIKEQVELRLDWPPASGVLIERITASGKPVVCVQLPRAPMGRTDGFGNDLLPDCRRIQQIIDALKPHATLVQIGAGKPLFEFSGIDIDLANQTTVREMLDVASVSSGFVGYCSFILPIAESLHKPCLMVWSRRGLESKELFIRRVTPRKMIEHSSTQYIIDDCGEYEMGEALEAFLARIPAGTT